MKNGMRKEGRRHNSTFAIGGVSCSADSLVVAESFVLRINISGILPAHRKSAKRYRIWSIKFTVPKIGVSNSPSGRLTD